MEDMEEVYLRMHMQLLQWLQRVCTRKTRLRLEVLLFVLASHLVVLACLLHVSFASDAFGHGDCLSQYFPPPPASSSPIPTHDNNGSDGAQSSASSSKPPAHLLLRIQIVPEQAEWIAVESKSGAGLPDVHYKDPQTSFVYAAHRGLLSLLELHNDAKRDRASALSFSLKDVPFETLYVPSSSACFDLKWVGGNNPLWKWFLEHVLGYDTILMNQLAKQYGARGFFYRESFKVIADMNYGVFNPDDAAKSWLLFAALKFKVLHTIVFLFFILTALVAFVLTETQKRMLTFTELFQNRSQLQLPVANLVLAYFAQSLMFVPILVGMLFFLFELYKDQLLAFAVLSMMWMGESFSVISVRSRLSQAYFPPLFFGLFAIFHLYFFAFPFGFSYVVFAAMAMLLGLLTLFFWNNFEIPALNHGQISLRRPREEGFGVSG